MTPADRSNSPPIISRPTPTATIPMTEDWYSTVKNDSAERKAGARARKKMKMMIAATSAPISGRASSRLVSAGRTRPVGFDGVGLGSASTVWLMITPPLSGVVLGERKDPVDVRAVHEGRTGQHRLAAADVVAVLEVEVERGDGHVALDVRL